MLDFQPQKQFSKDRCLPYADELDEEALKFLIEIKTNLGKSVLLYDIPSLWIWNVKLQNYIHIYGLKFSKEDHVLFIKLLYEIVVSPKVEGGVIARIAPILLLLLNKRRLLTPVEDLVLEWRPLYEVSKQILSSKGGLQRIHRVPSRVQDLLRSLINACSFYFLPSSTKEILEEMRPLLCPLNPYSSTYGTTMLSLFLPITASKEYAPVTHELWLHELMTLFSNSFNSSRHDQWIVYLMAYTAYFNIGIIHWEPYIPILFSRFLRIFKLPVKYKQQISNQKYHAISTEYVALWISSVLGGGSSSQERLDQLFQTLGSYCRPANNGTWVPIIRTFLKSLTINVQNRLYRERYAKPSWENNVPESHKLTDEDVSRFVKSVQVFAMQAMFSIQMFFELTMVFRDIAFMSPTTVIPPLLEKMYVLLDSVTEPHKLLSVLNGCSSVSRPMIDAGMCDTYKEGITHVIPVLFGLLPAIDANDHRKCIVSLNYISLIAHMVPIVNCSTASLYYEDLTPEEEVTCSATAQFEEFVLQYLDRCFTLIDMNTIDTTRLELSSKEERNNRSGLELSLSEAITHTLFVLIQQSSHAIFMTALKKMYNFAMSRVFERNVVAGEDVSSMIAAFSQVNPEETYKLFVPPLTDYILEYTKNPSIKEEETLENEFLYKLMILSECIAGVGDKLLPYIPTLMNVLEQTIHLRCKDAYKASVDLVFEMIHSLTTHMPRSYRSCPESYNSPVSEVLPIRYWGKGENYSSLNIDWYCPGEEEIAHAEKIVWTFLIPELELLDDYVKGKITLNRDKIKQSLSIIKAITENVHIFKRLDEPPLLLYETEIVPTSMIFTEGLKRQILMPDGTNIFSILIERLSALQSKLLESEEDDTSSFINLIVIWNHLLFGDTDTVNLNKDIEKYWKIRREMFINKLTHKNRNIPFIMTEEVFFKHADRVMASKFALTESLKKIAMQLLQLAVSHYSKVRLCAQPKIFHFMKMFPFSYLLFKDEFIKNLRLDVVENHEKFKGTLHLLAGPAAYPFVVRPDYHLLKDLYPAIVRCLPSEKLSIIKLINKLADSVGKSLSTFNFNWILPDSALTYAKQFWSTEYAKPNSPIPSDEDIANGYKQSLTKSEEFLSSYRTLMNELLCACENENLHWRNRELAVKFMSTLVHTEEPYSVNHVRFFLHTMIDDSLSFRKMAVTCVGNFLKQYRPNIVKELVNPFQIAGLPTPDNFANLPVGYRDDNSWLLYSSKNTPRNEEEWNQARYVYREHIGYAGWPRELRLPSSPEKQESLDKSFDNMSPVEKEIHLFFSEPQNVEKLIKYFSLEDKKDIDKYRISHFLMFRNLFRKFGDKYLDVFKPHLETLVVQTEKNAQCCACEIISGIINGARFWPYDKTQKLNEWLIPLLQTALDSIITETVKDWPTCFAMAFYRHDVNKISHFIELLSENPIKSDASFKDSARLLALQSSISLQAWRMPEFLHSLLNYVKPVLSHPYQQVREHLAWLLCTIFDTDAPVKEWNKTRGPLVEDFINEFLMKKFEVFHHLATRPDSNTIGRSESEFKTMMKFHHQELLMSEEEKKDIICLLQTVCKWVINMGTRSPFNLHPTFFQLLPLFCFMESYEHKHAELIPLCKNAVATLAMAAVVPDNVHLVLKAVHQVAKCRSWWSRSACLEFLQVFVFFNLPVISSNQQWVDEVTSLVEKSLLDSRVEVSVKAGHVFSGFLHCRMIKNECNLLDKFVRMSELIYRTDNLVDMKSLYMRHAGVLGLCAFVSANPYEVPKYVPGIFPVLNDHLTDPEPIPSTIRKTLSEFKRTHYEDWENCKQKFTTEQLTVLSDMVIPPPHYA